MEELSSWTVEMLDKMLATRIIGGVSVGVAVDKLLHHAINSQSGCQDQRCCSVVHAGVKISGAVAD